MFHQGIYGDQFPFYYHKLTSYDHGILLTYTINFPFDA